MSEMKVDLTPPPALAVPPLTRGWRMRMAMERAGLTREQMAVALGISASTASRWMHDEGKRQPRRPDMEAWARVCRVPIEWLAPDDSEAAPVTPTLAKVTPKIAANGDGPDATPRARGHLSMIAGR